MRLSHKTASCSDVPPEPAAKPLASLLTGVGFQIAVYLTGIVIGLFLTPYLLSVLGDRDYAIFIFAGLFTNWCGLVDFGMTTTTGRFVTLYYSKGESKNVNEVANTALVLFAGMGGCVLLISGIAAMAVRLKPAAPPDADLFAAVFLIAGGAFAVSKLSDALLGVVNGVMRQDISGGIALLFRILTGLTTFLIVFFGGRVAAIVGGSLALAVLNVSLLAVTVRTAYPAFRFSPLLFRKKRVRELSGYALFTFINQLGDLLIQRSDLIVIGLFLTLADVTCYNLVVVTFVSYFISFTQAMTLWETNWFTHLQNRGETELFEKSRLFSYKIMTFITVFMSCMLIFFADDFIRRWIGADYLDAFGCLVLIAAGMALFRGAAEVNIRVLQGVARHRRLAGFVVFQGILSVLLSVALVWAGLGNFGVALGTILPAFLIHGLLVPLDVCRLLRERPALYFRRQAGYLTVAGIAFLPPLAVIRLFLAPNYLSLAAVAVVCALLYFGLLGLIGLGHDERNEIRRFLKNRIGGKKAGKKDRPAPRSEGKRG